MPTKACIATIAFLAPLAAGAPAASAPEEAPPQPEFAPASRSVSNWRAQAGDHLVLGAEQATALASGGEAKGVTRCVRLNNYWCVKGVGWNGMIAADGEGHAAFASALEGATVAVLLLRRYYMAYSRRSAQAIVARWAPAQCGVARLAPRSSTAPLPPLRPGTKSPPGIAQTRDMLGPDPALKSAPDALSTRGVGQTLRARWMARGHVRLAKAGRAAKPARSRIAASLPTMMRAPSIAVGLGEKPMAMPELKLASLAMPSLEPVRPEPLRPVTNCGSEVARLANYALKASAGVVASPDDDLALFTPDGEPTPNLARVMENMSAVEIGPLRADKAVIAAGIERAMEALRQARASSEAANP